MSSSTTKDDFADFVKDPAARDGRARAQAEAGGAGAATGDPRQNPLALRRAARDEDRRRARRGEAGPDRDRPGPRRTYRVEAWGEIDRKQTDAEGNPVFPTDPPDLTRACGTPRSTDQNVRDPPHAQGGAWVFLKEE